MSEEEFNTEKVKEDLPDWNDVPDIGHEKEVRTSGYCQKCRERYTDVPVIDGVIICPNCIKQH